MLEILPSRPINTFPETNMQGNANILVSLLGSISLYSQCEHLTAFNCMEIYAFFVQYILQPKASSHVQPKKQKFPPVLGTVEMHSWTPVLHLLKGYLRLSFTSGSSTYRMNLKTCTVTLEPYSFVDSTPKMNRKHGNAPCLEESLCEVSFKDT